MSADYRAHFEATAAPQARPRRAQRGFRALLARVFRHHLPRDESVLEIGCGHGELLRSLEGMRRKVGLDFSPAMLAEARQRDPAGDYREGDITAGPPEEVFDHLILDHLVGYLPDVQQALEHVRGAAHARSRLYVTSLNHLWTPLLRLGRLLGVVHRRSPSNWLSRLDLVNLVELAGWEVVSTRTEVLLPWRLPLLDPLCNRLLVRLPLLQHLGSTLLIIARPRTAPVLDDAISCSVIVPARNEAGNIRAALERIPTLGHRTEVIFVEGNSTDDTWEVIQREAAAYQGPHVLQFLQQPGKGKWDAVFAGFARARGEVLVIQDGDLTAPPEDLPKFYGAIARGEAEFANGSRLVYPMEDAAMRFLNMLGNKFFAIVLSFLMRQPVKDSLCGTKMILRRDYERLLRRIEVLGDFDPFGDFNLLFGSALLNLRIRDIPVRYRARTYGDTNISRFRHGFILVRMSLFGLRRLRFHR